MSVGQKGQIMELNEIVTKPVAPKTQDTVKDAGRVRYGSGCIQFADMTPAREATKDAGRVRYGSGCIQF